MPSWIVILAICCVIAAFVWQRSRYRLFAAIPSPKGHPIFGHTFLLDPNKVHHQLVEWSKQCGPVLRLRMGFSNHVVANDFDSIYKLLVSSGKQFAGRPKSVRFEMILKNTGILLNLQPDRTWQSLRKVSHQHLRQFGSGLTRLEGIINEATKEMVRVFTEQAGKPFDPKSVTFDMAFDTIVFLITGVRLGKNHTIMRNMRTIEGYVIKYFGSADLQYFIYDVMPWLRFLRLKGWQDIQRTMDLEAEVWKDLQQLVKENPENESFLSVLFGHMNTGDGSSGQFSPEDVRKTLLSLLIAGVGTTGNSFYASINILAHNPDVQYKLAQEIDSVVGKSPVQLSHKPTLPYTQAFIYESLRYISLSAMGIFHRTLEDVELNGILIPQDTTVMSNLWALHHDEDFWDEPHSFKPERFLDEEGHVVSADHPNRRHLMPFGAGPRVCVGESLAMARIFLWMTAFVQHFHVEPAKGNNKELTDPRKWDCSLVMLLPAYEIVLHPR